ncbi:spindle and kinetochore-associated protein 2 isoform X1 [Panthera pardus]|uniref:Spindle and kinetochore-associated protein 2 isoform X1 n=1 Tax=Panthera pardus TaxID=9691 RepID=A0A9V1ER04_PANPR|nr:spindle and kinetochore-associated protein 2 isoform X1 [Panthera pardus]
MASKVGCNFESPETLGGRSWTRFKFPPLVSKGVAAAWSLLTAAGEGVTSGKLVREMAGDAEVAGPSEFLVPCPNLSAPQGTVARAGSVFCISPQKTLTAPRRGEVVHTQRKGDGSSRKLTLIWITFNTGWNMKSRRIILIQQAREIQLHS